MIVVTPTLKAAQVVATEIGSQAHSTAWLARQYGFSWDNDGRWTRELSVPSSDAVLSRGDLLLITEAGMLDKDTARALVTIADETGARLALVGDRHQLPAVGRGGVLDLAAHWAGPDARLTLDNVHRFADPDYAKLSLAMRSGENPEVVFDLLAQHGQIVVHSDEASRTAALADDAAATGALVVADTREQVADLNQAIRERLVTAGQVDDSRVLVTDGGERIGVGDRVATRRNDYDLGVANRDTWIVTGGRRRHHASRRDGGHAGATAPVRRPVRRTRLRLDRLRGPRRDHPNRPPGPRRTHRCSIGLRGHDTWPRGQYCAPRRRGSRRRPTAVDPHVRPQPHRPRPRACRPTRHPRSSQVRALC